MIGCVISENDPPYFAPWVILAHQSLKKYLKLCKGLTFFICPDASGTVLVWSPESEPCKAQGKPDNTMERAIGGAIRDICWGPDKAKNDMKLAFCGEGSSM